MLTNAFLAKPNKPTESELSEVLGTAKAAWDKLLADLASQYGLKLLEWHPYSPKAGWSLRVKHQKRNILYLSPGQGAFMASFALGDNALKAALNGGLPKAVIKAIKEATRYAEGTGLRLEARRLQDIDSIKRLVAIKLEH